MTIASPLNAGELQMLLSHDWQSPVAIRYPKDTAPDCDFELPPLQIGKGVELVKGSDGVIVIFGSLLGQAMRLQQLLQDSGKNYAVYHLRFAKPIHDDVIAYLQNFDNIILMEEGIKIGGIGEHLRPLLPDKNLYFYNTGDEFPDTDTREALLDDYNFNPEKILKDMEQ